MNIYVGSIPKESSENEIRVAFEQYRAVKSVNLIKDRYTNMLKGFGFVEMPNVSEADIAIKNLDGSMFNCRALTVNPAKPKTESSSRTKSYRNY